MLSPNRREGRGHREPKRGALAVSRASTNRPYLIHTGRASNAEKQPTGRGPEGRCIPRSQVYGVSAPVIVRGYGVPKDATPRGAHDILNR
jgi:hypothetical protein